MKGKFKENVIQIFIVSLIVCTFYYEQSGMDSALQALEKGKITIALTSIFSIAYLSVISTALVASLVYLKHKKFPSGKAVYIDKIAKKTNKWDPSVKVNPIVTKEILSQFQYYPN